MAKKNLRQRKGAKSDGNLKGPEVDAAIDSLKPEAPTETIPKRIEKY